MSKSSNAVLQQALELSAIEKAQLIEGLLVSLDTPDSALDKVWAAEADARVANFEQGKIETSSAKSVLSKYLD